MTIPKWIDVPPAWLVLFMGLAWFMGEVWAPLGETMRFPGLVVVILGAGLAAWAAIHFRRAGTTIIPHQEPTALVSDGPFKFSRNPIYLADMLILFGWCLICGTIAGMILLGPLFIVLERRFILPEEARLSAHLGEPYNQYRSKVRRWI